MRYAHIIKVKYLGATNTRGSRIKLTSHRFEDSITLNYKIGNALEQGIKYLEENGYVILNTGQLSDREYFITTSTFKVLKK